MDRPFLISHVTRHSHRLSVCRKVRLSNRRPLFSYPQSYPGLTPFAHMTSQLTLTLLERTRRVHSTNTCICAIHTYVISPTTLVIITSATSWAFSLKFVVRSSLAQRRKEQLVSSRCTTISCIQQKDKGSDPTETL